MADHLHPYPLTSRTLHLCVDMQRLFSTEGPWPTPWMNRVLPVVMELASSALVAPPNGFARESLMGYLRVSNFFRLECC